MKIEEERLLSVLEKVADKLEIKKWVYIKDEIDSTIENYFGVLVPLTLIGISKDVEVKKPFFIKFAPNDVVQELKSLIHQHYETELYTYCQLLPRYKCLSNIDVQQLIPECYYADLEPEKELIVLKDMRYEGYKRYEGTRFLDFDHICSSLKAMAQFHALSILFREKENDFDNPIMKPYTDTNPAIYFDYIKNSLKSNLHFFENTKYETFLRTLISDFARFANSATSEAKYLVYGHGDFWRENILFKYKDNKPIQACVLDFQKSRKMSPAQDVLLFLLTSTETCGINRHQQYLDIYLASLGQMLKENGVTDVYTQKDLYWDMKIVAPHSAAISIMAFSLWLGLENGNIVKSKHALDNAKSNLFKNTVIAILNELNHFGYIQL